MEKARSIKVNPTLVLHPADPAFAGALFALIDDYRAALAPYLDWVKHIQQVEAMAEFLQQARLQFGVKSKVYVIESEGKIVGVISFNVIEHETKTAYLGYWLVPPAQGRGIISQSLEALIAAHRQLLDKFVLRCAVFNQKSNRVAKRNGFEFECTLPKREMLNGVAHDQNQYVRYSKGV